MRWWISLVVVAVVGATGVVARGDVAAVRDLREQCDGLIRDAVKRPYGWGWTASGDAEAKGAVKTGVDVRGSAAAGLVLWLAGEALAEPTYLEAARQAGRGLAAGQHSTGKFAEGVTFGRSSAVNPERMTQLPDRGSTRAALGLLLTVAGAREGEKPHAAAGGDEGAEEEAIARAAARGARWLEKQQPESGAWPVFFPKADAKDAMRLVRLDTADTRDSVFAMLLAYEVLGDPFYRRSVEKSVEFLIAFRYSPTANVGAGLWQTAYMPAGRVVEGRAEFAKGLDALATRYAVQTILGVHVVLGDGQRLMACELATKSLKALMEGEGGWHRRFGFRGEVVGDATEGGSDGGTKGVFAPVEESKETESDPVLAGVMGMVGRVREVGREKVMAGMRERGLDVRRQLAVGVVGLSEGGMWVEGGGGGVRLTGALGERVGRVWEGYGLVRGQTVPR